MRKTVLYLSAASLFLSSYTLKNDKEYSLAEEHIKNLPEAPEGYKWVVNEDYTDEFNGKRLNAAKWHAKSPYWTNGRPPATFKAENVSVKKGCLRIINTVLSPTEGLDENFRPLRDRSGVPRRRTREVLAREQPCADN